MEEKTAKVIGYAFPIGGGWGTICIACHDKCEDDDPDVDDTYPDELLPIDATNVKADDFCEVCGQKIR